MIFTNLYVGVSTPVHHPSSNRYGAIGGGTRRSPPLTIRCCSSSDSNSGRGFGPAEASIAKDGGKSAASRRRKSVPQQPGSIPNQAPATNYGMDGTSKSFTSDLEFEEKLQAVKRSALNQKKAEEKNMYGTIDYDAPVASEPNKIGFGTQIGVGVAVVVFGLVFALGDFSPSGSVNSNKDAVIEKNTLSPEEKETLQTQLQQYEATLSTSPDDLVAREGAAVTLTELGDYTRAASMLEDLTKIKPSDPEVFRLLGEVKLELKDYEGSIAAYRTYAKISNKMDFQVLRGLTNALLAAKKPDEAVKILLATRDGLEREKLNQENIGGGNSQIDTESQLDPIQVELLLGKAYSDWGHVSDAVSVYDRLISSHPNDFRGYLAKGIILKANGKIGDAERMFIQARFFSPEGAKAVVDRYSRQ
ncbi:putative tetratricopeptide-like helical domain superfamily [Helianthus annuus]|nr:putative tetratricopeptide-like helical domain superfamily [Helianthus annuus]